MYKPQRIKAYIPANPNNYFEKVHTKGNRKDRREELERFSNYNNRKTTRGRNVQYVFNKSVGRVICIRHRNTG